MKNKEILPIILILIVGLLLYVGATKIIGSNLFNTKKKISYYIKPERTNNDGQLLPSFDILLPDSATYVNIGSVPPGSPTILFYYGPQCPFCQAEMKEIINNMSQLEDFQFYIFTSSPFSEMKSFYEQFQLSKYSNVKMGIDYSFFFGRYFRTESIPFTAIYGKDRRLKGAFIGSMSYEQIREVAIK